MQETSFKIGEFVRIDPAALESWAADMAKNEVAGLDYDVRVLIAWVAQNLGKQADESGLDYARRVGRELDLGHSVKIPPHTIEEFLYTI